MAIRLTEKRKRILDTLQSQKGALSAAQLHSQLSDIDLVTIYRSLDLFVKDKIVKKVHLGSDEALFEYQKEPHHHAVCADCEKVIHFKAPDAKIIKLLGLGDFEVDELEVTVRGKCRSDR